MPSSSNPDGAASPAAMLLDPKAYSRQLALGNSSFSSAPSQAPPAAMESASAYGNYNHPSYHAATPLIASNTPLGHGGNIAYTSHEGRRGPNPPASRSSRQNSGITAKPNEIPTPRGTAFDPRQLLSPKTYSPKPSRSSNATTMGRSDSSSDLAQKKREVEADGNAGQGSLIENMYGLETRGNPPLKKRKTDDEVTIRSASNFSASGNSGLGEYMKEGTTSNQDVTPKSSVIDLTSDKDEEKVTPKEDDDVIFVGDNDVRDREVCFGKLEGATIVAHKVPKPGSKAFGLGTSDWPSIKCQLRREPGRDIKIEAIDPSGNAFGAVDPAISAAIAPLMDTPTINIRVQARLDVRRKKENEWPGQPCSEVYRATLNVYGPQQRADAIGRYLSQKNVWLGTPNSVDAGISTYNPHAEKRVARPKHTPAAGNGSRAAPGPYEVRTAEEANSAIMKMFDQLTSADNLPEMDTPSLIATPLLRHQKQALWFMTEKEKPRTFGPKDEDNNSLWRIAYHKSGQKYYHEVITGTATYQEPEQVLGGLLADMMGLGKTLSILSLVAESRPASLEWEKRSPPPQLKASTPVTRNAKTTLLVSPLSAVNNWTEQIKEHVKENSFSYNVFHGSSRTTDADELAKYDIVITTYSTVLSEVSGKGAKRGVSPLMKLNLFRIVLDEAHAIREQSTAQSQAIFQLQAERRWSVTGTPIQNRLDDLGAVTKFLKLYPYDDRGRFSSHILNPFKNGDVSVLATLRVLVDSFTLRRVKDRIDLPPRHDKIVTLEFSDDERSLYDIFKRESNVMMNVIAGENKSKMAGKMYHHVLKAMMQLRRICAHGKELLDPEDRERLKGLSVEDAIDLEDGDSNRAALSNKKTYEMYALMKESSAEQCVKCGGKIEEKRTESGAVDKTAAIAVMLPCCDVLCIDCFKPLQATFDQLGEARKALKCLFCDAEIPPSYSLITPAGFENYQQSIASDKAGKKRAKSDGLYEKPHSKTKALMEYLEKSAEESQLKPDEPPIKSVVFSSWTSHLDLIEIALADNGITGFTRLDGTMTLKNRNKALDTFRDDPSVTILLVTLGAGGVGLNLTAGSNVYIMEPQYNPAAVAQAVDRIHRLGQTREVTTIQFIMKDSIEEKIAELAKKKQQLADLSMNRGKLDKREVQQSRMKEYRSLFK